MASLTLCSVLKTLCFNVDTGLYRPNGHLLMSAMCRMLIISTHCLFVNLFGLLWITSLDPHHTWAILAHRDQMFWTCGSVNKIVRTNVFVVSDDAFRGRAVQILQETWFIIFVQRNEILHLGKIIMLPPLSCPFSLIIIVLLLFTSVSTLLPM